MFSAPTTELFPWNYYSAPGVTLNYDMASDGDRFLMIEGRTAPPRARAILVQNWFEELKRLVPTQP